MKMRKICRIQVDMGNQRNNVPDWVGKMTYRCNYMPDRDSYLPYRGRLFDSHMKFS